MTKPARMTRQLTLDNPLTQKTANILSLPETRFPLAWRHPIDLPVKIYKLYLAIWAMFIGVFWVTFSASLHALFVVGIASFYAVIFFGVPIILARQSPYEKPRDGDLPRFLRSRVEVFGGILSGRDIMIQILLVPVCLTFGAIGIGLAIHAARNLN